MERIKEEYPNRSSKVLTCRACLSTKDKLYHIHEDKLTDYYAQVVGSPAAENDGLPQYLCVYCRSSLLKCAMFRARCRRAQRCLSLGKRELTTDYIQTIDRQAHRLDLNLKTTPVETLEYTDPLISTLKKEPSNEVKDEREISFMEVEFGGVDDCNDDDDVEVAETFFAEPAEIKKEKRVRKRLKKEPKVREKKKKVKELRSEVNQRKTNKTGGKIKYRTAVNDFMPEFDFAKFESTYKVSIEFLSKEQQLAEVEARRQAPAAYRCQDCGKGFSHETTYSNHIVRHSPSMGPHACQICFLRFRGGYRRQQHQDRHRLKLVCTICNFVSRDRFQARRHYSTHAGKMYECSHCGASFTQSSTYLSHVRLKHPSENVACELCGEMFVGKNGLIQHKAKAHKASLINKCTSCGLIFETEEALLTHTGTFVDERCDTTMKHCLACGEALGSEDELQAHKDKYHNTEQFTCKECDKTFANSTSYEVHYQRIHLNVQRSQPGAFRAAVCHVCGRTCQSVPALERHLRVHTGERPYQCKLCPRAFALQAALDKHYLTHSDSGEFSCDVCHKTFLEKKILHLHCRSTHLVHTVDPTDERPYKCSLCPKEFKHKCTLKVHQRDHSGERPFKCHLCPSDFKQSPHLTRHLDAMHQVKRNTRRKKY